MYKVKFLSLNKEYVFLKEEIDKAIRNVIESGQFILGKEVEAFERNFASYIGTRHGIGVASGTDAIFLALNALNLPKGSEVITQSFTFISVADSIVRNNLKPIFCDINEKTFNSEPEQIKKLITKNTSAIIVQNMYGLPSKMDEIIEISKDENIFVIEDCSHAHGATYKNRKVGSFGHVSCFSFYPAKILGAYGDAGIVLTNNDEIAERLRMLRNYGQRRKYYHDLIGYNSRLDEIQAAILNVKLKYLDEFVSKRRKIAQVYKEHLFNTVEFQEEYEDAIHAYGYFVIKCKYRDKLHEFLKKEGIETIIHYPLPIHQQNSYKEYNSLYLPFTEKVSNNVLSLPMHPFLENDEIEYLCRKIIEFYK
jgi:Predicted pyridoxal phosphate-dependent enzyme apparently involved in regulation of cell wall biogenesis